MCGKIVALSCAYAIRPFAVRPSKILIMKYIYCLLSLAVAVSAHAGHTHDHDPTPRRAIVRLDGDGIHGNITFTELPGNNLHLTGTIFGMPPGSYGFHVHEFGDITNGCVSAGAHFNPDHKEHGHPKDENRHVGDLGNIVFDENQVSNVDITDHLIALHGPNSIIGRAVVLHERADDFGRTDHPDSRKTGNAGGRVACGVIGIL